MGRTYTVHTGALAVSASPTTLVQIKPGVSSCRVRRMKVAQNSLTSSSMQDVAYGTSTGAASVTTATPAPHDLDGAAAKAVGGASATGTNASAEGSGKTEINKASFNVLNGWEKILTDAELIEIPGGGGTFFYLSLPNLPNNATFNASVTFEEIG